MQKKPGQLAAAPVFCMLCAVVFFFAYFEKHTQKGRKKFWAAPNDYFHKKTPPAKFFSAAAGKNNK